MCQVYFPLADWHGKIKKGIEHLSYKSYLHAPGRDVFMQSTQKSNVNDNPHKYPLLWGCWAMDLVFERAELI